MKCCCYTLYNNRKKICSKCKKKLIKSTNKYLLYKLPHELIQNIFRLYYKSKYMYYYSNLSLVSKYFNYNFNILYKSFKSILYQFPLTYFDNLKASIFYVKSVHFNIKFAKLYFHKSKKKFKLLFGEENMLLATHKYSNDICYKYIDIYYLQYFEFIIF